MINVIIGIFKFIEDLYCFYFNKVIMFYLLNFNMLENFIKLCLKFKILLKMIYFFIVVILKCMKGKY